MASWAVMKAAIMVASMVHSRHHNHITYHHGIVRHARVRHDNFEHVNGARREGKTCPVAHYCSADGKCHMRPSHRLNCVPRGSRYITSLSATRTRPTGAPPAREFINKIRIPAARAVPEI